MSERGLLPGWHRSIFVKLLAIMVAVLLSVSLVVWIVGRVVFPSLTSSRQLVVEYTRLLAATAPDRATAEQLAADLDLQIRYEGPDGAWTTAPGLPTIAETRRFSGWHDFYLAPGGKGGTYLVAWEVGRSMGKAHTRMVQLLLLFVAGSSPPPTSPCAVPSVPCGRCTKESPA